MTGAVREACTTDPSGGQRCVCRGDRCNGPGVDSHVSNRKSRPSLGQPRFREEKLPRPSSYALLSLDFRCFIWSFPSLDRSGSKTHEVLRLRPGGVFTRQFTVDPDIIDSAQVKFRFN